MPKSTRYGNLNQGNPGLGSKSSWQRTYHGGDGNGSQAKTKNRSPKGTGSTSAQTKSDNRKENILEKLSREYDVARNRAQRNAVKNAAKKSQSTLHNLLRVLLLTSTARIASADFVDIINGSGNDLDAAMYPSGAYNASSSEVVDSSGFIGNNTQSHITNFVNDNIVGSNFTDGILTFESNGLRYEFKGFKQDESGNYSINSSFIDPKFHRLYQGKNLPFPVLNARVTNISTSQTLNFEEVEDALNDLSSAIDLLTSIPPDLSYNSTRPNRFVLNDQSVINPQSSNQYVATGSDGRISDGQHGGSLIFSDSEGLLVGPNSGRVLTDYTNSSIKYATGNGSDNEFSNLIQFEGDSSRLLHPEGVNTPSIRVTDYPTSADQAFGIVKESASSVSRAAHSGSGIRIKEMAPSAHRSEFIQMSFPTDQIRSFKYDAQGNLLSSKTFASQSILQSYQLEGPNGHNIIFVRHQDPFTAVGIGYIDVSSLDSSSSGSTIDITPIRGLRSIFSSAPDLVGSGAGQYVAYQSLDDGSVYYKVNTGEYIQIETDGAVSTIDSSAFSSIQATGNLQSIDRYPNSFELNSGAQISYTPDSRDNINSYTVNSPAQTLTHAAIDQSNANLGNLADSITINSPTGFTLATNHSSVVQFAPGQDIAASDINFQPTDSLPDDEEISWKLISRSDAIPHDIAGSDAASKFDFVNGLSIGNITTFDPSSYDSNEFYLAGKYGNSVLVFDTAIGNGLYLANQTGVEVATTVQPSTTDTTTGTTTQTTSVTSTNPTTSDTTTRTTTVSTTPTSTGTVTETTTKTTTITSTGTTTKTTTVTSTPTSTVTTTKTVTPTSTETTTATTTPTSTGSTTKTTTVTTTPVTTGTTTPATTYTTTISSTATTTDTTTGTTTTTPTTTQTLTSTTTPTTTVSKTGTTTVTTTGTATDTTTGRTTPTTTVTTSETSTGTSTGTSTDTTTPTTPSTITSTTTSATGTTITTTTSKTDPATKTSTQTSTITSTGTSTPETTETTTVTTTPTTIPSTSTTGTSTTSTLYRSTITSTSTTSGTTTTEAVHTTTGTTTPTLTVSSTQTSTGTLTPTTTVSSTDSTTGTTSITTSQTSTPTSTLSTNTLTTTTTNTGQGYISSIVTRTTADSTSGVLTPTTTQETSIASSPITASRPTSTTSSTTFPPIIIVTATTKPVNTTRTTTSNSFSPTQMPTFETTTTTRDNRTDSVSTRTSTSTTTPSLTTTTTPTGTTVNLTNNSNTKEQNKGASSSMPWWGWLIVAVGTASLAGWAYKRRRDRRQANRRVGPDNPMTQDGVVLNPNWIGMEDLGQGGDGAQHGQTTAQPELPTEEANIDTIIAAANPVANPQRDDQAPPPPPPAGGPLPPLRVTKDQQDALARRNEKREVGGRWARPSVNPPEVSGSENSSDGDRRVSSTTQYHGPIIEYDGFTLPGQTMENDGFVDPRETIEKMNEIGRRMSEKRESPKFPGVVPKLPSRSQDGKKPSDFPPRRGDQRTKRSSPLLTKNRFAGLDVEK